MTEEKEISNGVYLYCIREKTDSNFSVKGIDGGKVFTLPHKDLEAVVCEVSLKEFDSKEIEKRANQDLKWIKEKAELHQRAIEQAMGVYPERSRGVIPMKFGTIFKNKQKLKQTLEKYYNKFKKTLEHLAGKQEWGVKVYLDRRSFDNGVKKSSPVVHEKEKEIASMSGGEAYFAQKQIDEAILAEADKAMVRHIDLFFEILNKHAETSTRGKILDKELTGKSQPMILNAIFLISEEKLKDFIKEINKLSKEYKPKGFTFEYSGPWPPYNFI